MQAAHEKEANKLEWVSSGVADAAAKQNICIRLIFIILAKKKKQSIRLGETVVEELRKYAVYASFWQLF